MTGEESTLTHIGVSCFGPSGQGKLHDTFLTLLSNEGRMNQMLTALGWSFVPAGKGRRGHWLCPACTSAREKARQG